MNYLLLIIFYYCICSLIWKLIRQRRQKDFKKDILNTFRHKRSMLDTKQPPFYPSGWHAVLSSDELHINQVKNFIALGNNLLAFRDKSLKIYVADAFCSHLIEGNGKVLKRNGDDILNCPIDQCSFRLFDGSLMQFNEEKINFNSDSYANKYPHKIKIWEVYEANNMIYIWYNTKGHKSNSLPHSVEDGLKQISVMSMYAKTFIQDLSENIVDIMHFNTVHKYYFDYKTLIGKCINNFVYNEFDAKFSKTDKKWKVNLEAGLKLIRGENLRMDVYFTGNTLAYARGSAKVFGTQYEILFHFLPLYMNRIKFVINVYSLPSFKSKILGYFLPYMIHKFHLQDIPILVNKCYLARPLYTKEDKKMKEFREWAAQQY